MKNDTVRDINGYMHHLPGCPDHYGLMEPLRTSKGCRDCEACWAAVRKKNTEDLRRAWKKFIKKQKEKRK